MCIITCFFNFYFKEWIWFFQNGFENQEEVNAEHKAMLEEDKKIAEWQEQQMQKYFAEIEKENVMSEVNRDLESKIIGKGALEILEEHDITVNVYENDRTDEYTVELQYYSDAGEDFSMNVKVNHGGFFESVDFAEAFLKTTNDFDVDEHAEMWIENRGKNGTPSSIRVLLKDAESIKEHFENVANKVMENKKKESRLVHGWLRNQINENTNNNNCLEFYADYNDHVSEETVLKIMNDRDRIVHNLSFETALENEIYDLNFDNFISMENDLYDTILENAKKEGQDFEDSFKRFEMYREGTRGLLEAGGYNGVEIDVESFLNNDYKLNLMFATQTEVNLDMSSITDFYASDFNDFYRDKDDFEEHGDNALTYLIHQQGYDVEEVLKALNNEDFQYTQESNFVKSVIDEIEEYNGYIMSEVTVLVSAKGRDLIDLIDTIESDKFDDKKRYIEFSKGTTIGLYNEWIGCGSNLDIALEKPAVFPCDMVCNIQIEGAGRENDGYSVNEVYGMVDTVWTEGKVSIVDEKPILKEENLKEVFDKISKPEKVKDKNDMER